MNMKCDGRSEPTVRPPTVYGVLLNQRAVQNRLKDTFSAAPYKAAPQAPVLYIKPANTHASSGARIAVPRGANGVEINATLGLVFGRPTSRVSEDAALNSISGLRIACDLSVPHQSVYRPAIRQRCRDGFLPMSEVIPIADGAAVDTFEVKTFINGVESLRTSFSDLVRQPSRLIADVSDFMSFDVGDVMLIGLPDVPPIAGPGDHVRVEVSELGDITFDLVLEEANEGQA